MITLIRKYESKIFWSLVGLLAIGVFATLFNPEPEYVEVSVPTMEIDSSIIKMLHQNEQAAVITRNGISRNAQNIATLKFDIADVITRLERVEKQ